MANELKLTILNVVDRDLKRKLSNRITTKAFPQLSTGSVLIISNQAESAWGIVVSDPSRAFPAKQRTYDGKIQDFSADRIIEELRAMLESK